MLFHITYEFSPQERDGAQKRFKETGAPPPDGVTMQGRWHGAAGHIGCLIALGIFRSRMNHFIISRTDIVDFL